MCIFTNEQNNFIIKTGLLIQQSNKKLTFKNDLPRLYNEHFPDSNATFIQLYRCFNRRPSIKVKLILFVYMENYPIFIVFIFQNTKRIKDNTKATSVPAKRTPIREPSSQKRNHLVAETSNSDIFMVNLITKP